jgi:hypothetical protein
LGFTAHREKYAKALRLELEEEMARAEERLESWPKERLAKEGYALFRLRGLHDGNLQRDAVVRVLIPRGKSHSRCLSRSKARKTATKARDVLSDASSRWAPSSLSTGSGRATW